MDKRKSPNPESKALEESLVGGVGIRLPEGAVEPPEGYAAIVLYVPIQHVTGQDVIQLQNDLGIPWTIRDENGSISGAWLDEMVDSTASKS
jgi:hypothetical protein